MYKNKIPADFMAREVDPREPMRCHAGPMDVAALEQQANECHRRYVQVSADFENYKRRAAQEVERLGSERKEAFIRELLPVFDNLGRAMATAGGASSRAIHEGLELIHRQYLQLMRTHGFECFGDVGERFDPNLHEATSVRREPSHEDESIVEVWQRGWTRNGRLFRAAKVVVNDTALEAADASTQYQGELSHV